MKQNKQTFYAVARGYKTGIFTAWFGPDGCQAQTKGYKPNPVFRKFFTLHDAEEFLASHGIVAPLIQAQPPAQTSPAQTPAQTPPAKAVNIEEQPKAPRPQRQQGERRDHLAQAWAQAYNSSDNWKNTVHTHNHDNWSAPPSQSQFPPSTDENQPHWGEGYLKNRMRDLKKLRINLPSPPAKDPVDRHNINASIVSEEWCNAHDIPVPSELIDGEYQLAQEVYRRVLYSETWTQKDLHIQQYFKIVDDKRDYNLQQTSDVTFQCLDRHAKLVRRVAHDSAQIRKTQDTEKILRSNYEDLEKVNIKLCLQVEEGRERFRLLKAERSESGSVTPSPAQTGRRGSPTRSKRKETPVRTIRPTRKQTPTASEKRSSRNKEREITTIDSSPERVLESPSPTTTESPTHHPEVSYESPGEDELELSNLNLEELSNRSERSNISSPNESSSDNWDPPQEHPADPEYESEYESLSQDTVKSKSKSKKKITFDLTSTGNYSACEFCIQGFGKRTGHRGPHLTKRRTQSSSSK